MTDMTKYDPEKDYSPVTTCVELYDSICVICNHIDDFIMSMIHDDVFGDADLSDIDIIDAVFDKVNASINKFYSNNRGDYQAVMNAKVLGKVPEDRIRWVKNAPIKTEHIVAYATIELETTLQDLEETPIPTEMQEAWCQLKPGFTELMSRCKIGLSDAETLVNKIKELTKDL